MLTNPLYNQHPSLNPPHCATLSVGWYGLSQCPCWGSVLCVQWSLSRLVSLWQCGMKGVCSGSKFSPSPESMGQSCSEPGSDCRAPGYPCSGRGNVCDYLLCKPPSWRRKKRGGGNGRERQFSTGTVCLCVRWQEELCACRFCVCMCVCCDCVFIVCFGREMSRGTCDNRVGIVSV